jgi:aminoglycoside/choline kinase family phosphotransferase
MALQRHLKVLGIFARLNYRDGKPGYLGDLPVVLDYVRKTANRYRELKPLVRLLDTLENKAPEVGYTF